jgi:hypothetical protein
MVFVFSASRISRAFNALTLIERWMRRITAVAFISVGVYYCLVHLFGVL